MRRLRPALARADAAAALPPQWYSAEDWLPAAVDAVAGRVQAACGGGALHVLDAGVGTSPCLFALAALRPARYAALHGVDFAAAAVAFLQRRAEEAAAAGVHAGLRFWAADARTLHGVPDASVDLLLDKGCLDCFVTGDGGAEDVAAYLAAVARVLRGPHARVLLLAVNAADVPRLLATGEIAPDAHAGGGGRSGIAWCVKQVWCTPPVAAPAKLTSPRPCCCAGAQTRRRCGLPRGRGRSGCGWRRQLRLRRSTCWCALRSRRRRARPALRCAATSAAACTPGRRLAARRAPRAPAETSCGASR